MSINKLTERIEKDAIAEAAGITKEAETEASGIIDVSNDEAKSIKDQLTKEAQRESLYEKDAVIAQAKLQAKDMMLEAKRRSLDKVFTMALKKLEKSSKEEYENRIIKMLVAYSEGNEKVAMQEEQAEDIVEKANTRLAQTGKEANLQVADEKIKGQGFILIDEKGSRQDFLFETVIDFYKEELEQDVFAVLSEGVPDEH